MASGHRGTVTCERWPGQALLELQAIQPGHHGAMAAAAGKLPTSTVAITLRVAVLSNVTCPAYGLTTTAVVPVGARSIEVG
jgi:hypothetical protein